METKQKRLIIVSVVALAGLMFVSSCATQHYGRMP